MASNASSKQDLYEIIRSLTEQLERSDKTLVERENQHRNQLKVLEQELRACREQRDALAEDKNNLLSQLSKERGLRQEAQSQLSLSYQAVENAQRETKQLQESITSTAKHHNASINMARQEAESWKAQARINLEHINARLQTQSGQLGDLMDALKKHMANEAQLFSRPTLALPPNGSFFGPVVTVPLTRRIKQEEGENSTELSTQDADTDESAASPSEVDEQSSAASSWTESFTPRKRISLPENRFTPSRAEVPNGSHKKRKLGKTTRDLHQEAPMDGWEEDEDEDDEMAIGYSERKSLSKADQPSRNSSPRINPTLGRSGAAKTPTRAINLAGTRGSQTSKDTIFRLPSRKCVFSSRRFVQTHRGLEHAPFVLEQLGLDLRPGTGANDGHDLRLRLFFYEENEKLAYGQLAPHCREDFATTNRKPFQAPVLMTQLDDLTLTAHAEGPTGQVTPPPLVIRPLFISGPSENRVDLVFFSDGYTNEESEKFFSDAYRLAKDMSQNQTFAPVSPLQNYWAAFSPSTESGIGNGGKPRNKLEVARATALSLGTQCDYPILLANDPMYGGLGGEFTITTASQVNGALVLRHELGHSIIEVGEEYDGGYAYFGANSQATKEEVKWRHWLTPTNLGHPSPVLEPTRIERSNMPLQLYPWKYLTDAGAPFRASFYASGTFNRYSILFSVSGAAQKSDLIILLDGRNVEFNPRKDIGRDRWHYEIHSSRLALPRNLDSQAQTSGHLEEGTHEIEFRLGPTAQSGQVQLCSVEIIEFGDEEEFNATPGSVSLFPTFSSKNTTTYRPTNDACLMRRVTEPDFCPPCLEALWLQHFKRVDLIDKLALRCLNPQGGGSDPPDQEMLKTGGKATLDLKLLPLAQFRRLPSTAILARESFTIEWYKDMILLPEHTNSTSLPVDESGVYEARVEFATSHIRRDDLGLAKSSRKRVVLPTEMDGCTEAEGR
ncbi:hypothetical protein FRC01_007830 [Tulasnella sp. 417]|nr:hypothetical protein FRC01_007830 [Tulasnella sp. 417]